MRTKIQRWGHRLAVRIPKPFAIEAKLTNGTEVDLTVMNGKLVVALATKPAQSINDLLARVTNRNLHSEVDTGASVGREAW
jgi:antitoxin MazE